MFNIKEHYFIFPLQIWKYVFLFLLHRLNSCVLRYTLKGLYLICIIGIIDDMRIEMLYNNGM